MEDPNVPKDGLRPVTPQDPAPQTPPVTEPAQPVSTPQPTPPVSPEPVSPAVQPQTPIDTTAIEEKVSKSVIDKIGEALGLTKKEAEQQIPTDPQELAKYVQENTKKTVEQILGDKEKQEREAQESQQKQIQEGEQKFQTLWHNQFTELAETGKVPKTVNPQDVNDPGNQVRVKLLTKLSQVIRENEAKGIDYVPTLKEIFYEFPEVLQAETTTGADVPVSGGGRSMAQGQTGEYNRIHNADVEDLVKQKYSQ